MPQHMHRLPRRQAWSNFLHAQPDIGIIQILEQRPRLHAIGDLFTEFGRDRHRPVFVVLGVQVGDLVADHLLLPQLRHFTPAGARRQAKANSFQVIAIKPLLQSQDLGLGKKPHFLRRQLHFLHGLERVLAVVMPQFDENREHAAQHFLVKVDRLGFLAFSKSQRPVVGEESAGDLTGFGLPHFLRHDAQLLRPLHSVFQALAVMAPPQVDQVG